ncbi:MAG: hypothetical protein H0U52_06245 [Chloroflexi bacterium]|nr:hypothetical protein [Chloroflexota bacterium]
MHPFALYLAVTDVERNNRADAAWNRRPRWAPVDALPINEPAKVPPRGRLMAMLRRRAARVARAASA